MLKLKATFGGAIRDSLLKITKCAALPHLNHLGQKVFFFQFLGGQLVYEEKQHGHLFEVKFNLDLFMLIHLKVPADFIVVAVLRRHEQPNYLRPDFKMLAHTCAVDEVSIDKRRLGALVFAARALKVLITFGDQKFCVCYWANRMAGVRKVRYFVFKKLVVSNVLLVVVHPSTAYQVADSSWLDGGLQLLLPLNELKAFLNSLLKIHVFSINYLILTLHRC